MRNLGYTRNAGEFVRQSFADIGSAGGHRSMAKALLPLENFREKFGNLDDAQVPQALHQLINAFLKD